MNYWLMKSEPSVYSIDDLKKEGVTHWEGVRNYQARNFMRDQMQIGDQVFFYHSNTTPPGIVGLAKVCKEAYPDFTAWDKTSPYYDPKSTKDTPRWLMVDIAYVSTWKAPVSLDELKRYDELTGLFAIKKGMRLSVQPVEKKHFDFITSLRDAR